jgi:hypothetical protein
LNTYRVLSVTACATLASCASQLYDWNIQHAYIAPAAQLSRPELEQVIRTTTDKSLSTVIGVTRLKERGKPDEIVVYTAGGPGDSMMIYNLQKGSDGSWHIVDSDSGHIIVY